MVSMANESSAVAPNELWEKQPGESDRAWGAFQIYRDLADRRTYQAVAEKLECSHNNVRAWASRHDWRVRADAFDRHQDDENRKAMARGRLEMRERQGKIGVVMQRIGTQGLTELQAKMATGTPLGLTIDECVRMIAEGAKIERVARGDDAETQYTKINVILSSRATALQAELAAEHERELQEAEQPTNGKALPGVVTLDDEGTLQ